MKFSSSTLLGLLMASSTTVTVNSKAIQSGPYAGSTYASSTTYDVNNEDVFITGITYDENFGSGSASATAMSSPRCFVTKLYLDNNEFNSFDSAATFGTPNVLETCTASALVEPSTLVLVGNSEQNGLYASDTSLYSGFGLAVDKNNLQEVAGITLSASPIRYPMFATAKGKSVYMVAYTATDTNDQGDPSGTQPDWIVHQKYGTSLEMSVLKMDIRQEYFNGLPVGDPFFTADWDSDFPMDAESDGTIPRVYLGGVILKGDKLIVVGSTRGLGDGYGDAEDADEDGYITVLNPSDGSLVQGKSNERIGTEVDDLIAGVCDDPNDPDHFYVVGATRGALGKSVSEGVNSESLKPFIEKIEVLTLHSVWAVHYGATKPSGSVTTAVSQACVVKDDVVYMGGTVWDGASMVLQDDVKTAGGKRDVWVASLDGATGHTNWMQQIGSDEDDVMAENGAMTTDQDGNVVIAGSTRGSLFRQRDDAGGNSDIFVAVLDKLNGAYDGGNAAPTTPQTEAPTKNPTIAPVQPMAAPVPAPTLAPVPAPTQAPVAPVVPPHYDHEFQSIGVQFAGPLYAGGIAYDTRKATVYMTGAGYTKVDEPGDYANSVCYVVSVSMDDGTTGTRNYYGRDTDAACSAISYDSRDDFAYALGYTEGAGLFSSWVTDVNDAFQYGTLFQIDAQTDATEGGGVNDQDVTSYPVAVLAHPEQDRIFAAYVSSDFTDPLDSTAGDQYPDYTLGGYRKYGKDFFLVVKGYDIENRHDQPFSPPHTIHTAWYQYWDTDEGSVEVSGMAFAGDGSTLVVVGSTRESGDPFGDNDGTDMDGYLIKFNVENGELFADGGGELLQGGGKAFVRLDSANNKDDWITGICSDPFDQDSVYVVGKSLGEIKDLPANQQPPAGTMNTFVAKIHLHSLGATWIKHFVATPPAGETISKASPFGCAVAAEDDNEHLVYVVGIVESDAVMQGAKEGRSFGGDDLFVMQLDSDTGATNWIRQIGTNEDEDLAESTPIDVDEHGNPIVQAETQGDFYAEAEDNDIVIFTMNKEDGYYKPLIANGGTAPVAAPVDDDADDDDDDYIVGVPENTDLYDFPPDDFEAIQTGPDVGPSYAGGMVYDGYSNAMYLTGATYGAFDGPGTTTKMSSSCFFGVLRMPRLRWQERSTYGTPLANEACSALALGSYGGKNAAILAGSAERDGLLTRLGSGQDDAQYGIAIDLANIDGEFGMIGGALMDGMKVQQPVAVVNDGDDYFFLQMTSQDTSITPDFSRSSRRELPNYTTGGTEKYGSSYSIVIEKRTLFRSTFNGVVEETLKAGWRKPFETADLESVYPSGMIEVGDILVGVGSTRAQSGGKNEDMDGIIFKVSKADGGFVTEGNDARSVSYFTSPDGADDWILNACPDPDDDQYMYVVGATRGSIDASVDRAKKDDNVHALISKVHVRSLVPAWTKQFPVTHASGKVKDDAAAIALGCAAIPDEGRVYVTGDVENGATIDFPENPQTSEGNDDFFIGLLDTDRGDVLWLRQMGSRGDDRVARGGGVIVDDDTNAVVYGDTNGALFRDRSDEPNPDFHDLFAIVFRKKDGRSQRTVPQTEPKKSHKSYESPSEWFYEDGGLSPGGKTVLIIFLVLLCLGLIAYFMRRRRYQKEKVVSEVYGGPIDHGADPLFLQQNIGGSFRDHPDNDGGLTPQNYGDNKPGREII